MDRGWHWLQIRWYFELSSNEWLMFYCEILELLNFSVTSPSINNKEMSSAAAKKLEQELSSELPQFMHTEIIYTLRRLLPADLKVMYVGSGENEDPVTPNPFCSDWECTPHQEKGGVRVTRYITFNWWVLLFLLSSILIFIHPVIQSHVGDVATVSILHEKQHLWHSQEYWLL